MRARSLLAGAILALCAFEAVAQTAASGDPAAGSEVFEDRCASCHGGSGGQGPNLKGVVGRKAGAVPAYAYSAALKASGLTWTAATLDRFLTDPGMLVPGTAMAARIPDPRQRRDLIAYLASRK